MLRSVDDGILGILFLSDSPNGLFIQQSLKKEGLYENKCIYCR